MLPAFKTSLALSLAISLALCAHAAVADTNLLSNGSFENPDVAGNPVVRYGLGSTAITGWTVVGGEIELVRTENIPAAHGKQWIDLTGVYGYNKGLRSDAIATTVGKHYTLSFDLGDYGLPGFQTSTLGVSINGGSQQLFTNVYDGGTIDWERKTFDWVANSASTQITFTGVANGNFSNDGVIGLDNVVLQAAPVPEPSTYALMISGLALLGFIARRKRK